MTQSFAINSNFGTVEDLQNLATALHDRGMYLMVDVVANHFVRPKLLFQVMTGNNLL
jgi:glycosidase